MILVVKFIILSAISDTLDLGVGVWNSFLGQYILSLSAIFNALLKVISSSSSSPSHSSSLSGSLILLSPTSAKKP